LPLDISNSVLIQWFSYQGSAGKKTSTFPYSFTTNNYTCVVIINSYTTDTNAIPSSFIQIEHTDNTKITWNDGSSKQRRFIAIGF